MQKLTALFLVLALSLLSFAMAETDESVTTVNTLIEEGSFIVQIPVAEDDFGWVADDMSQDDSIVKLYDADVIEDTFVARYDAVGDGDITVCVKHMNDLACDVAFTWDLHVQDGAVQEVLGGSHTTSPDELEQDPYIAGDWLVNEDIMAGMTITKNEGQGWALQIATAYPEVYVFQADMAYDCELDAFVYSNATVYQSEITESPDVVLGDVLVTDACGTLTFVETENGLKLEWYNALSPEETVLFERPEGWDEDSETAEGAGSDWYMAVLTDPEIMEQYPCHSFVDVNENGVPVLIVTTTENAFITDEDQGRVYVYDAGEPKLVMEVGGQAGEKFYGNLDSHTLTYYYRMSGEAHIEVYEARDGALTLVTKVDSYEPNHGPAGDAEGTVYFQDDEEISPEDGEALFEQYAGEDDVITYEELPE